MPGRTGRDTGRLFPPWLPTARSPVAVGSRMRAGSRAARRPDSNSGAWRVMTMPAGGICMPAGPWRRAGRRRPHRRRGCSNAGAPRGIRHMEPCCPAPLPPRHGASRRPRRQELRPISRGAIGRNCPLDRKTLLETATGRLHVPGWPVRAGCNHREADGRRYGMENRGTQRRHESARLRDAAPHRSGRKPGCSLIGAR